MLSNGAKVFYRFSNSVEFIIALFYWINNNYHAARAGLSQQIIYLA